MANDQFRSPIISMNDFKQGAFATKCLKTKRITFPSLQPSPSPCPLRANGASSIHHATQAESNRFLFSESSLFHPLSQNSSVLLPTLHSILKASRSIDQNNVVLGEGLATHETGGGGNLLNRLLRHDTAARPQIAEVRLAANDLLCDWANVLATENVLLPVVGRVSSIFGSVIRIHREVQIHHILELSDVGELLRHLLVDNGLDDRVLVEKIAQFIGTYLHITRGRSSHRTL